MEVYVLFCSGEFVKASLSLQELKDHVLEKMQQGNCWNYEKHWNKVAYEIFQCWVPVDDDTPLDELTI